MIDITQDIHALVMAFLKRDFPGLEEIEEEGRPLTKAGLLPFTVGADGAVRFYVMRPRAGKPHLPAPLFQICKGTRMRRQGGAWADMLQPHQESGMARDGEGRIEPLAATALREGIEELGLKLENIGALHDFGRCVFASATTGKSKSMRLFACGVKSPLDFLPDARVADSTDTRIWCSSADFASIGRRDHLVILADVERRLKTGGG